MGCCINGCGNDQVKATDPPFCRAESVPTAADAVATEQAGAVRDDMVAVILGRCNNG